MINVMIKYMKIESFSLNLRGYSPIFPYFKSLKEIEEGFEGWAVMIC